MYGYEEPSYYGNSGYVPRMNMNQGQLADPFSAALTAPNLQGPPAYEYPDNYGSPQEQWAAQQGTGAQAETYDDIYSYIERLAQANAPKQASTLRPFYVYDIQAPPEPAPAPKRAAPKKTGAKKPGAQKADKSRSYSNAAGRSTGGIRQSSPGSYTNAPLPAPVAPAVPPGPDPRGYYGPVHVVNPRFQNPKVTPHRAPVDTRGEDY